MRKYFLITLADGHTYERPIPPEAFKAIPVGAKANDRGYLGMALQLATQGFCEDPEATPPRWIAPSQVKHVEVVFESNQKS